MSKPNVPTLGVSLSLITIVLSVFGLISLNSGAAISMGGLVFGSSQGLDQSAFARLKANATRSDLDEAARRARMALQLSPYLANSRLRLVYIDAQAGRLSPAGLAEFSRTYDLIPRDPAVAAWRIQFGLEHWTQLNPATRRAVYEEVMAFGRLPSEDVPVRRILGSIHDPSGSLAAALWLRALESNPA